MDRKQSTAARFVGVAVVIEAAACFVTAAAAQPITSISPPTKQVEVVSQTAPLIRLSLVDPLSSRTARTGQHFDLTVVEDVMLGEVLLIPKGSIASGTVLFARKKGMAGRSGALDLRVDKVIVPSGTLALKSGESRRGAYLGDKAILMGLAFGILGQLVVQSDDINLHAGQEFVAVLAPAPTPSLPVSLTTSSQEPDLPAPVNIDPVTNPSPPTTPEP